MLAARNLTDQSLPHINHYLLCHDQILPVRRRSCC